MDQTEVFLILLLNSEKYHRMKLKTKRGRIMKKIVSFITSLAIVGSCCALNNFVKDSCSAITASVIVEQGTYQIDDESTLGYKLNDRGEMYVCDYKGTASEIVIPSEINGKQVNSIAAYTFRNCTGVTSITIPDSITAIYPSAFMGCTGLTSLKIPNGISSIRSGMCQDCSNLRSVTLPDKLNMIEIEAFENCTSLEDINVPADTRYVLRDSFTNTKWYDDQPDGMVVIGQTLYKYKGAMPENTTAAVPDNVKVIGESAFEGCTGMVAAEIAEGVEEIDNYAFKDLAGLKKVRFPSTLKMIYLRAFENCTGLKELDLSNGVENINDSAFMGCTGLKTITLPNNLKTIFVCAFEGCTSLESITIPEGANYISYDAFKDCTSLRKVTIPESMEIIEGEIFGNCSKDLTIYGYRNSVAETYAKDKNIKFSVLDPVQQSATTAYATTTSQSDTTISNSSKTMVTTLPISSSTTPDKIEIESGDLNSDGKIDANDATTVLFNYSLLSTGEPIQLTETQQKAADVNEDGKIDASDATMILQYYSYLSTGGDLAFKEYMKQNG